MRIEAMMDAIMGCLWRASWQASVIGLLVLGLRWMMGRRLSARWRSWLWMLVLLRLAQPALPPSPWSLFNLIPTTPAQVPVEIQWPVETIIIHVAPSRPVALMPQRTMRWPGILAGVWLSGVVVLSAWTVFVNLRFARQIRFGTEAPEEIVMLMARLGRQMHVRLLPRTVMTDALATPALFGLVRPRLLLPFDFSRRLTEPEIRFVLLHELAHVRRWDLAIGWISCALRIVHWFNPLVWIFSACHRADAESACDEMVLGVTDEDRRIEYGHTLLKMAEGFSPDFPASALGVINGKTELRQRLLGITRFRRQAIGWSVAALLLLLVLICVVLTDARKDSLRPAQEPAPGIPVSRKYEVQDVVFAMDLPDYGNAPALSIAPSNEKPPTTLPGDPVKQASKLVEIIRKAVPDDPFTSSIDAPSLNKIDITFTARPSTQAKIEAILGQIRADKLVQISMSIRIFTFDPEDAQELSFALPGDGPDAPRSPVFISEAQLNEIRGMVQHKRSSTEFTAPRLTLFNHQKVYIVVNTDQSYVADYTTTTRPNGQVDYVPKSATIPAESVLLDVRVNESENHESTGLNMHVKLERLDRLDPGRVAGHPDLEFKIPREFVSDVSAAVNVKKGQTALFAGGVDSYNDKLAFITISPKLLEPRRRDRP
jgi:beta-lactamase regulating signal transducer with metallopeptidase domain